MTYLSYTCEMQTGSFFLLRMQILLVIPFPDYLFLHYSRCYCQKFFRIPSRLVEKKIYLQMINVVAVMWLFCHDTYSLKFCYSFEYKWSLICRSFHPVIYSEDYSRNWGDKRGWEVGITFLARRNLFFKGRIIKGAVDFLWEIGNV